VVQPKPSVPTFFPRPKKFRPVIVIVATVVMVNVSGSDLILGHFDDDGDNNNNSHSSNNNNAVDADVGNWFGQKEVIRG
jgi:hypothetical protein